MDTVKGYYTRIYIFFLFIRFVDYMKRSESALSEYDFMDENCDELKNDFPFSFTNEDLN